MDCDYARALASAGLDQEAGASELKAAEQHFEGCSECGAWMESLHVLNRSLRIQEAAIPDFTESIMHEWDRVQGVPRATNAFLRPGLAVMGVMTAAMALPMLIGGNPLITVASNHPTRELAGLGLMMAAAFLFSAWDGRARGRVAIVLTGVSVTLVASIADLVAGNVTLPYEFGHLPAAIGLVLLWALSREEDPAGGEPHVRSPRQVLRQLRGAA